MPAIIVRPAGVISVPARLPPSGTTTAARKTKWATRAGANFLGIHYSVCDEAMVTAARAAGIALGVYTVNDEADLRRLAALGLTGLKCFPQMVSVVPGSERIERYQQQILAALTPAETEAFRQAAAAAERDGTFFIAQAYHCAVGTKPG